MTMTISVTQEHIDKGKRSNCKACPIALAMVDAGLKAPSAWPDQLYGFLGTAAVCIPTPHEARRFMDTFDVGKPVSPFTFTADFT